MKRRVIVLSSIEWGFLWQRHQILAKKFADAGFDVVFVESSAKRNPGLKDLSRVLRRIYTALVKKSIAQYNNIPNGLSVISPLVLPSTYHLFRIVNELVFIPRLLKNIRRILKGTEQLIIWCYLPTATSLAIIEKLSPRILIYDCVTNYLSMANDAPKDIADTELRLIKQADLVFTDSDYLYKDKVVFRNDIIRIPPGVNRSFFNLPSCAQITKKKICYFGSVDERINFDILKQLAGAGYKVVLVGPVKTCLPSDLPSEVRFIGEVRFEELPSYIMDSECLIIPYQINEFTSRIMPAKIYECLATGKPLVATPLPDLLKFDKDLLYIGYDTESFINIVKSLDISENEEKNRKRREVALSNSWEKRFEEILGYIEERQ
jgi:hypothetical protein